MHNFTLPYFLSNTFTHHTNNNKKDNKSTQKKDKWFHIEATSSKFIRSGQQAPHWISLTVCGILVAMK